MTLDSETPQEEFVIKFRNMYRENERCGISSELLNFIKTFLQVQATEQLCQSSHSTHSITSFIPHTPSPPVISIRTKPPSPYPTPQEFSIFQQLVWPLASWRCRLFYTSSHVCHHFVTSQSDTGVGGCGSGSGEGPGEGSGLGSGLGEGPSPLSV